MWTPLCKAALIEDATNIIPLEFHNTTVLIYQVTRSRTRQSPRAGPVHQLCGSGHTLTPGPLGSASGGQTGTLAPTLWTKTQRLCRFCLWKTTTHSRNHGARGGSLLPVNLCSRLGVALGLPHAEGLLLLADLLQPLLLQEQHQGVPHVHHLNQPLEDAFFFFTLLRGLLCQANTVAFGLTRLRAASERRLGWCHPGHPEYTPVISMYFRSSSSNALCLSSSSSWRDLMQDTNICVRHPILLQLQVPSKHTRTETVTLTPPWGQTLRTPASSSWGPVRSNVRSSRRSRCRLEGETSFTVNLHRLPDVYVSPSWTWIIPLTEESVFQQKVCVPD